MCDAVFDATPDASDHALVCLNCIALSAPNADLVPDWIMKIQVDVDQDAAVVEPSPVTAKHKAEAYRPAGHPPRRCRR